MSRIELCNGRALVAKCLTCSSLALASPHVLQRRESLYSQVPCEWWQLTEGGHVIAAGAVEEVVPQGSHVCACPPLRSEIQGKASVIHSEEG
jgi:hypothetical protein